MNNIEGNNQIRQGILIPTSYRLPPDRGTGIVANSSTFRPQGVIRDLFRLLHAVLHSTETLV